MTEPLIEQLIKAYDELIDLSVQLHIAEIDPSDSDYDCIAISEKIKIVRQRITALIKNYRERRRFVNTIEKHLLGPEFEKPEDAISWQEEYNKKYPYQKLSTIEIIRNKP